MLLGDLGRRGDQGRAARGRCHQGLGATVGRRRRCRCGRGGRPAHGGLLPGRQPQQARPASRPQDRRRGGDPAAPDRRWRRPGRELPGRRVRPARLRRGTIAGAQSAPRPPRDLGLRDDGPRRGPARLRLRDPGGQRTDVDHRRPGCRRWRADQGRGRHQRRRVGDVRRGRDPGRARRAGAGGRAGRRSRPAGRRVAARVDPGDPGQPGAERVRQRRRAGPARQRPPEHRAVRDLRDGRRRDRDRGRVRAPVAAAVRGGRSARPGRATRASPPTATGSSDEPSCAPSWPRGSPAERRPTGCESSRRPRSRSGRSTMSSPPSHRPRPSRSG